WKNKYTRDTTELSAHKDPSSNTLGRKQERKSILPLPTRNYWTNITSFQRERENKKKTTERKSREEDFCHHSVLIF
uniref:Uncharacterized protein n=1 Tax=Esox lucius TaxID=8010 RepID=A0A6Q2YCF3_ESOLU